MQSLASDQQRAGRESGEEMRTSHGNRIEQNQSATDPDLVLATPKIKNVSFTPGEEFARNDKVSRPLHML